MAERRTNPESSAYPEAVTRLIDRLGAMPGIGRRSAERIAFHLLKGDPEDASALARAIVDVKQTIRHCAVCWNLTHESPCPICEDARRDRSRVLVVEQPKDLIALEQTGLYRGLYHVLMGRLSPLDGIGPSELTVDGLLKRLEDPAVNPGGTAIEEVILGLNATVEGDGTALYLAEALAGRSVKVSRLARGLPAGWSIEQANPSVLADAIQGRQSL